MPLSNSTARDNAEMLAPLTNVRILDLTNVLAGPFCCHQLAHLGADVIKVEAVGRGDLARQLGADASLNHQGMGVSFLAQNAGKKSVTINLKHAQGKALFLKLLATADVVVENFRPGVMQRLGLGFEQLQAVRADIIYCAISGFGQDGPWVHRPAYDQIVQGVSGLMSLTGDKHSAPLRTGSPMADTVGGMTAAFAIAAALNASPRGAFIDVSMLESLLASMGWVVSNYLIANETPVPNGNENPTSAPSGTFQCADAPLNIAANKDEQWQLLTRHLDLEHLQHQAAYRTREDRKTNRLALKAVLESVLTKRPARLWTEELNAMGIPAGEVLQVPDILRHPQIADRGFLSEFTAVPGIDRDIQIASTGVKIDGVAPRVETPPPRLGEHNELIFGELGLSTDDLQALESSGAI